MFASTIRVNKGDESSTIQRECVFCIISMHIVRGSNACIVFTHLFCECIFL